MSTKTSHRRRTKHHRRQAARSLGQFFAEEGLTNLVLVEPDRICRGQCRNQGCEECHDIDNCVEGTVRYGDLLLCQGCRGKYPKVQPWRVCPETGEYIDAVTGRYL